MLSQAVAGINWPTNGSVIHGNQGNEDCGVYKLDETNSLILTTDFFTPVVDDPFLFGQVAAANALSDIYAMGGKPLSALNLVCYPEEAGSEILHEILKGGASKAEEAGCPILGGHSVNAPELKYGLAITGIAPTKKITYNGGAKAGDQLILTKALGTGILNTAIKRGELSDSTYQALVHSMASLNAKAAEIMMEFGANGATDVTGFSLMGHGMEMARASGVNLRIDSRTLPQLPDVMQAIEEGHVTRGNRTNREYTEGHVELSPEVSENLGILAFDPQTSGGLLISIPSERAADFLKEVQKVAPDSSLIGEVIEGQGKVLLR